MLVNGIICHLLIWGGVSCECFNSIVDLRLWLIIFSATFDIRLVM